MTVTAGHAIAVGFEFAVATRRSRLERGRWAVTARQTRALRGSAAAAIATLVAATAHTLSGGGAAHPLLIVSVAALAAPLAVWLAGHRGSWWRTGLVVCAAQALFHLAFAAVGDARPLSTGHAHHLAGVMTAPEAVLSPTLDPAMMTGHLAAALVTIVAVRRGEQLLRVLGRGILRLVSRAAVSLPQPLALPSPLPARSAVAPPRTLLDCSLSRRGPPAFAG